MFKMAIILYGSSFWKTAATQICGRPQGIIANVPDSDPSGTARPGSRSPGPASRSGGRRPDSTTLARCTVVEDNFMRKKFQMPNLNVNDDFTVLVFRSFCPVNYLKIAPFRVVCRAHWCWLIDSEITDSERIMICSA